MEPVTPELYIEDKKILTVEPVENEMTPLGDPIFLIKFDDDTQTKMTMAKFILMQTDHKSDATAMRAVLTKEIGSKIYGMLMEYGVKFSEIDPCLNETIRLINDGQNVALNILWGNEIYDRSLLDVNKVLLTKYGEETPDPAETVKNSDGIASDGGTPDTEDTKQV